MDTTPATCVDVVKYMSERSMSIGQMMDDTVAIVEGLVVQGIVTLE